MNLDEVFALRNAIWGTRDACGTHYPKPCPEGCPNAGVHDASIGELCECHTCRTAEQTGT